MLNRYTILIFSLSLALIKISRRKFFGQGNLVSEILFTSSRPKSLAETSNSIYEKISCFNDQIQVKFTDNFQPKDFPLVPNTWKIIGFATLDYLPIADIWYQQLENLGYDNHYLVPVEQHGFHFFGMGKMVTEDRAISLAC